MNIPAHAQAAKANKIGIIRKNASIRTNPVMKSKMAMTMYFRRVKPLILLYISDCLQGAKK
jgi:hypothetical protein